MARGVNKVTLIGNLGSDPEVRTSQGGMTIANFRLATNERRKDGDNWKEHTEWHRIVAFGRLAEICRDYLSKGRQVYIEGSIRTNKWTDKEGQDRYTTEIIANEMQMLGGRDGDGGGDRPQGGQRGGGSGGSEPALDDEDIPF